VCPPTHTDGVKGKTAAVKRQLINRATEKNGNGRNGNRKIGQPEKSATKNKRVGNRATQN